ncbi:hypothetical protein FK85_28330 [Halorubrum saccharovorum]|uniref:YqcI/YcgG family protein n=1 Tax=Halorubrum saccharovorum TaxID=2248 RepID=A0A0F8D5A9_9EURY|nr:hypothetical protein FK85_28330 [Halorubrum saccharovorum]
MNEPGTEGVLLDQETLHDRLDDAPGWLRDHYRTFRESMLGERDGSPFPCYFGIEVEREGDLLYAACESTTDPAALLRFRDVLVEYLDRYENHADRAPLAVFFRPPDGDRGEAHYHERLWHVLEFLHVHDPERGPTTSRPTRTHPASSSASAASRCSPLLARRSTTSGRAGTRRWGSRSPSSRGPSSTGSPPTRRRASAPARRSASAWTSTTGSVPTPTSATGASRATASGNSTCSARTATRARTPVP